MLQVVSTRALALPPAAQPPHGITDADADCFAIRRVSPRVHHALRLRPARGPPASLLEVRFQDGSVAITVNEQGFTSGNWAQWGSMTTLHR